MILILICIRFKIIIYFITILFVLSFILLYIIYDDDMKNSTKSDDPLTNNGMSNTIWLYVIHKDDDTKFNKENVNEYKFVDFYLKWIYLL